GLGHQQLLGVRGLVVDRDPHVGQHRDHALDLLGVGHVVRQVIVDLGVREVAAVLAEDDEVLQALFLCLDLGLLDLGLVLVSVVVLAGFLCCHGAPAGAFRENRQFYQSFDRSSGDGFPDFAVARSFSDASYSARCWGVAWPEATSCESSAPRLRRRSATSWSTAPTTSAS